MGAPAALTIFFMAAISAVAAIGALVLATRTWAGPRRSICDI